jgi:N-acylneuraminate cytidylyltransferase
MSPQKLLAVIPARGGSKRVPLKNVRDLAGRPSIAYSIDAAKESGLFHRVIVSTDSERIAEIAVQCGAEVPFMRSADLADDYAPVSLVTVDVLERLDSAGTVYGAVAQLMANCPLRTAEDVRDSYRQFSETGATGQISLTKYGWLNPWWAVTLNTDFRVTNILPESLGKRSQDLPEVFCPTGAIWWATAEALRAERSFHTADKRGWEMPWQRAVDIDTEEDWQMAEVLLKLTEAQRPQNAR